MTADGVQAKKFRRRVWKMIRGQVLNAAKAHPSYFNKRADTAFIDSVAKRVYGQVLGKDFKELLSRLEHADGGRLCAKATTSERPLSQ